MSVTHDNQAERKLKEAKAIIKRFNQGTQTADDESLVNPFAHPGERDWKKALERFVKSHQKTKEEQLSMFIDNGLMFGFAEDSSAAPVQILRSSLFAPIAKGRRKALTRHPVAQFKGGQLLYSGVQLDQADLDVMLLLTRLLSDSTATDNVTKIKDESGRHEYSRIKFTRYALIKKLNRKNGGKTNQWLEDSITRLGGKLQANMENIGLMSGPIIGKFGIEEKTEMMFVDINHDYVKLFGDLGFSFISLTERLKLNSGFAKWLHAFVSTHRGRATYSSEKLMELSSCHPSRTRQWMQRQATPAFESLVNAGTIKWYKLDGHLYHWFR